MFLKYFFVSEGVPYKNDMFVGKWYVKDGLWKLNAIDTRSNVMTGVKSKVINKNNSYANLLESFRLWHEELGHASNDSIRKLMNLDCIPKIQLDPKHKCETCVEAILMKTSFHTVETRTEPPDLIHSDLSDFKFVPTIGDNKYL